MSDTTNSPPKPNTKTEIEKKKDASEIKPIEPAKPAPKEAEKPKV